MGVQGLGALARTAGMAFALPWLEWIKDSGGLFARIGAAHLVVPPALGQGSCQ